MTAMSSKVVCPLDLINNCQSEYPNGKGCRNYDYCHEHASTLKPVDIFKFVEIESVVDDITF